MHGLEGPLGGNNCGLQWHETQACHVVGYHCLVADYASRLGEDERVALMSELEAEYKDADAAGYARDSAQIDFHELEIRCHRNGIIDGRIAGFDGVRCDSCEDSGTQCARGGMNTQMPISESTTNPPSMILSINVTHARPLLDA